MRQSFSGVSASVSTPLAKLREPARTRMARRPPNSGTVIASSTSRDGSAESSSPSRLTSENGPLGGGTAGASEPHKRKRIVGVVDRGRQQRLGALAHEAGIGTVEQDDGTRGIGPGEKRVDFFSAQRNHRIWIQLNSGGSAKPLFTLQGRVKSPSICRRQVPATKNAASRVWMFSAISWEARSSASR